LRAALPTSLSDTERVLVELWDRRQEPKPEPTAVELAWAEEQRTAHEHKLPNVDRTARTLARATGKTWRILRTTDPARARRPACARPPQRATAQRRSRAAPRNRQRHARAPRRQEPHEPHLPRAGRAA
jgi:hypothetical protein